jgi:hypothetical protein
LDSGGGSGSSSANSWIVTVTGFRGNSLGPPVGDSPNWVNDIGFSANANGGTTPTPVIPGETGNSP